MNTKAERAWNKTRDELGEKVEGLCLGYQRKLRASGDEKCVGLVFEIQRLVDEFQDGLSRLTGEPCSPAPGLTLAEAQRLMKESDPPFPDGTLGEVKRIELEVAKRLAEKRTEEDFKAWKDSGVVTPKTYPSGMGEVR